MPDILDELQDVTRRRILTQHQPLPLDPAVDRELERLAQRTRAAGASGTLEPTMKFTAEFLSEEEQAHVHEESLRILSTVGVKFHGQKALPLLEQHGARVDRDSRIARIPAGDGS